MGEFKELFIAKIHTFHPVPLLTAVGIGSWVIVPPLALGDTATPSMADQIQTTIQAGLDKARTELASINAPPASPAGSSGVTVVMPGTTGSVPAQQQASATPGVSISGAAAGVAAAGGDTGGGGGSGGSGTKSSRTGSAQTPSQQSGVTAQASHQAAITGSISGQQSRGEPQPAPMVNTTRAPVKLHPTPVVVAPPVVVQPAPPPVVVVRPPPPAFALVGPFISGVLRPPPPGRAYIGGGGRRR